MPRNNDFERAEQLLQNVYTIWIEKSSRLKKQKSLRKPA